MTLLWNLKRVIEFDDVNVAVEYKNYKWLADEVFGSPNNSFMKASAFGGRPRNSCARILRISLNDVQGEHATYRQRIEFLATPSGN